VRVSNKYLQPTFHQWFQNPNYKLKRRLWSGGCFHEWVQGFYVPTYQQPSLSFKRGSTHTWHALDACHKENKSPEHTTPLFMPCAQGAHNTILSGLNPQEMDSSHSMKKLEIAHPL
jgi:hypothetical protein